MAHGAARTWAVSVRLRRVLGARTVRRLLVIAGLAVAGWLLGGLSQAYADSGPLDEVAPAEAPAPRELVRRAAEKVPALRTPPPVAERPASSLPVPEIGEVGEKDADAPVAEPAPQHHDRVVRDDRAKHGGRTVRKAPAAPVAASGAFAATRDGTTEPVGSRAVLPGSEPVSTPHDAPLPAPEQQQPGTFPAASGSVLFGGFVGHPCGLSWTHPRPRHVLPRAPGVVAPAVRTAADEPSYAPD